MSALQLQAYELMGKLSDSKLQLIIEIMNGFINATDESNNEVKGKRPIGMFEGEKFLADNYDIDDDNAEIAAMFGVSEWEFYWIHI